MSKLLSICIPTFNRANYLKLCLSQFCKQMAPFLDEVELLVVDNHSTDHTKDIVADIQKQFPFVSYYRQEQNVGADGNFYWCFKHAAGIYVWIFGDDDILLDHKLKVVMGLLKNNQPDVVYLGGYAFSGDDYLLEAPKNKPILPKPDIEFDLSKEKFLNKVHYNMTFATANIVNKSILPQSFNCEPFLGLNLIHTCWIFEALILGSKFAVINEKAIAAKTNNTGGYKLFETFSENFNKIIQYYIIERGMNFNIKRKLQFNLLLSFFPQFILHNKDVNKNNTFINENPMLQLKLVFGNNIWYYLFVYPTLKLNYKFGVLYNKYVLKNINRVINAFK